MLNGLDRNKIIQYDDIRGIIADFQYRDGTALLYAKDGEKRGISYRDLGCRVIDAAFDLPSYADSVVCDGSCQTLIRILADIFAGRDTLLGNRNIPPVDLEGAARMLQYRQYGFYQTRNAVCFFTSGTTRSARVVVLTQKAIAANVWSGQSMLPCGPGDIIYSGIPIYHVYGFVTSVLWGLTYGATVAMASESGRISDDLMLFRPTILPTIPRIIDPLAEGGKLNPELKTVLIGGAAATEKTVNLLQDEGRKVYLGYGLTETASGVAISQDQDEPFALYPCPDTKITINEDSSITVDTPCIMEGYLGEPELMDTRINTGDTGYLDEQGRLHLTGRVHLNPGSREENWKTQG